MKDSSEFFDNFWQTIPGYHSFDFKKVNYSVVLSKKF
jgi:hypothetical protein